MYDILKIMAAGDRALVVEFGNAIDIETTRKVQNLASALKALDLPALLEMIPTYRSLLISYDPLATSLTELKETIMNTGNRMDDARTECTGSIVKRIIHIPTLYGDDCGPDIGYVANNAGMTVEDVIKAHSGSDYLVQMIGFTPGFPYLGGLDERLSTPRLESPRTQTPVGSVGIAEGQTCIYTIASPGGWRVIGRTPVRLFDSSREPPSVLTAGDYLRFVALNSRKEYQDIEREIVSNEYEFDTELVA